MPSTDEMIFTCAVDGEDHSGAWAGLYAARRHSAESPCPCIKQLGAFVTHMRRRRVFAPLLVGAGKVGGGREKGSLPPKGMGTPGEVSGVWPGVCECGSGAEAPKGSGSVLLR